MALNDVLTSMDGARDALVTAINAKGGSLADNATLYQCADAVGSLSGGTSAEYYKCASVDTSAKTWSGYKAVLNDGVYTFEDTVTKGLKYTSVTPKIGSIYSPDVLVKANLYTGITDDGLLFYAPLDSSKESAETGQTLQENNVTFETYKGIDCAVFRNSYVQVTDVAFLSEIVGNVSTTQCVWICSTDGDTNPNSRFIFNIRSGNDSNGSRRTIATFNDQILTSVSFNFKGTSLNGSSNIYDGEWHFVCCIHDAETNLNYIYIDNILENHMTFAPEFKDSNHQMFLGISTNLNNMDYYTGRLAGVRLYKRALLESEITTLYNEYQPITN